MEVNLEPLGTIFNSHGSCAEVDIPLKKDTCNEGDKDARGFLINASRIRSSTVIGYSREPHCLYVRVIDWNQSSHIVDIREPNADRIRRRILEKFNVPAEEWSQGYSIVSATQLKNGFRSPTPSLKDEDLVALCKKQTDISKPTLMLLQPSNISLKKSLDAQSRGETRSLGHLISFSQVLKPYFNFSSQQTDTSSTKGRSLKSIFTSKSKKRHALASATEEGSVTSEESRLYSAESSVVSEKGFKLRGTPDGSKEKLTLNIAPTKKRDFDCGYSKVSLPYTSPPYKDEKYSGKNGRTFVDNIKRSLTGHFLGSQLSDGFRLRNTGKNKSSTPFPRASTETTIWRSSTQIIDYKDNPINSQAKAAPSNSPCSILDDCKDVRDPGSVEYEPDLWLRPPSSIICDNLNLFFPQLGFKDFIEERRSSKKLQVQDIPVNQPVIKATNLDIDQSVTSESNRDLQEYFELISDDEDLWQLGKETDYKKLQLFLKTTIKTRREHLNNIQKRTSFGRRASHYIHEPMDIYNKKEIQIDKSPKVHIKRSTPARDKVLMNILQVKNEDESSLRQALSVDNMTRTPLSGISDLDSSLLNNTQKSFPNIQCAAEDDKDKPQPKGNNNTEDCNLSGPSSPLPTDCSKSGSNLSCETAFPSTLKSASTKPKLEILTGESLNMSNIKYRETLISASQKKLKESFSDSINMLETSLNNLEKSQSIKFVSPKSDIPSTSKENSKPKKLTVSLRNPHLGSPNSISPNPKQENTLSKAIYEGISAQSSDPDSGNNWVYDSPTISGSPPSATTPPTTEIFRESRVNPPETTTSNLVSSNHSSPITADSIEKSQELSSTAVDKEKGNRISIFCRECDIPSKIPWKKGPLIGKGSFGKVFYGINLHTCEIMAVKQVQIGKRNNKFQDRLLNSIRSEIALMRNISHENVVQYLGVERDYDIISIYLEYVSGGTIRSILNTSGPFENPLVRSITCQVLCGLEYLHERNIIHRDIKGNNILINEDGVAKISDFGVSKRCGPLSPYKTCKRMSFQGSVKWMAPEVIKSKGYSAKVDIWSLGCVIIEMITGDYPWSNFDQLQTVWRLGRGLHPTIPPTCTEPEQNFLHSAFTMPPSDRPTAAKMLKHPFADVDPAQLDFRAYKEKKRWTKVILHNKTYSQLSLRT